MQVNAKFSGTGGELLRELIGALLITMITLGLYSPWYIVKCLKYVAQKTTIHGTSQGDLSLSFNGTGGEYFKTVILGSILTGITFGIYFPWFVVNLHRFFVENIRASTANGTEYGFSFQGTGGAFFKEMLIGQILTMITFGIYSPWFLCTLYKLFLPNTDIVQGETKIGGIDFHGEGGSLFGTYIAGILLSIVTFGVYTFWFSVKLGKFFLGATRVTVGETTLSGNFTGSGIDYFKIYVGGSLLTIVTFGIYGFWLLVNFVRWQLENTRLAAD